MVNVGGPGQWNSSGNDIATLMKNANITAGGTFGIDTTNAPGGFTYGTSSSSTGFLRAGQTWTQHARAHQQQQRVYRRHGGECGTLEAKYPGSLPLVTAAELG